MKKSIILLVLFLLFILPLSVASADTNKNLNISVFTMQKGEKPSANNKTYKWIKSKFGVSFTWDILVGDEDQKIGLLIASGNLPDLVEVDSDKFQNAGCLRDLKPLIEEYAPNLKKHYESVWKKMIDQDSEKNPDGSIKVEHIYSLPYCGVLDGELFETYYNQTAWWIQKAVLKEFGYPKIKTIDEYFNLIEAYYKKHPTIDGMPTIPFNIITADWEAFDLWNPPTFLAGYSNDGNGHVDLVNGKYIYTDNFTDANAKRWFKLANKYFNKGLIDPASFTDNRDQYYDKISQGRVLGMFIQGWQFMFYPEKLLWSAGKDERTYVPLPIVFDESIKPHYRDQPLPNLQRGYGITVKCSKAKAIKILQFMDKMLEEENQRILYWGFEGEDWQRDAQGRPYRTDRQRLQQNNPVWILQNRATFWATEAPKLEGKMPSGYTRVIDDLPWEYAATQKYIDLEVWKAYGVNSYAELMDKDPPKNAGWYPMWQCSPSPEKGGFEAEAYYAMMGFETLQRKYLPLMILGRPADFEKTWAEYAALMKPLTEKYNKFMQQELDKRVEQFGGLPE